MDLGNANDIVSSIQDWSPPDTVERTIGTIEDYIPMIVKNPSLADLAHARLYHMVATDGIEWEIDPHTGRKKPRYNFFKDDMFGVDDTLAKIVDYMHSGGRRLPVRKRILLLMGPVGGGKSTIVDLMKKGLTRYTATDEGAVYAIKGCPVHEDPLNMLPQEMRDNLHGMSNGRIYVEGTLCPSCKKRLDKDFDGDFRHFEIERIYFSEAGRKGIGTYVPSDPKSQDVAELVGAANLAKLAEVGVESDPDAYQFDGEIDIANRGMLEMVEMLKCDEKHLYVLLTVSQEQQVKTPRFPMTYVNMVVIAHTNETEWNDFMRDDRNEALQDRIITIPCPYVLTVNDEVKIYRKELITSEDSSSVAIAPRTLDVCAMYAILSRLEESKDRSVDLLKKMKAYNGEDVKGLKPADVRRLKQEADREGMSGLGPRAITNAISEAITSARDQLTEMSEAEYREQCFGIDRPEGESVAVDAIDMMRTFHDLVNSDPQMSEKDRTRHREMLDMARSEFDNMIKRDVQEAFCYEFQQEAETLFRNYLKNVVAFVSGDELVDDITGEHMEPDQHLMSSVERMIDVGQGSAREFRDGIVRRMAAASQRGKDFEFSTYGELKDAIEKKIFDDRKDLISITTTSTRPDPEQMKEINRVIRHLVDEGGEDSLIRYTTYTAAKAVRYVGKLLNR